MGGSMQNKANTEHNVEFNDGKLHYSFMIVFAN